MENLVEELKNLIAGGQIELVFERLSSSTLGGNDEIILISSHYYTNKGQYVKSIIKLEDYNLNLNRISDSLLQIINDYEFELIETNKDNQENSESEATHLLSYEEVESRIESFFSNTDTKHFDDLLSLCYTVIKHCVHNFNSNNVKDCCEMYWFFIENIKNRGLGFIRYRLDCDAICREYIFNSFNDYTNDQVDAKNERKHAQALRSVIDTIPESKEYIVAVSVLDDKLISYRDTFSAIHGDTVIEIVNLAVDQLSNFQKKGSVYLGYHLAMNYLTSLGEYFRKQKYWLNRSQKRISLSISNDVMSLHTQGTKFKRSEYANLIMEFNEMMFNIHGMMEMNLEFYGDYNEEDDFFT